MSILKPLLYPFAWFYGQIISLRNHLFDIGFKREFDFEANIIGVGNLTVGGTGKSPMVEYLIRLLTTQYSIATLSRGYGRNTKGMIIASDKDTASTLGDEPVQFLRKFKNISVVVAEERAIAIPHIIAEKNPDVIIMDDSYQHRYVKPSLNLLLSDYNRPFYQDYLLPYGRLRETKQGALRADAIVVTKCPESITQEETELIHSQISSYTKAPVFFSSITYGEPLAFGQTEKFRSSTKVIAFSGLANDIPFKSYLNETFDLMDYISFPDHYDYKINDLQNIVDRFKNQIEEIQIVTTEKDMVKLTSESFEPLIKSLPIFCIPISHQFVKNGNVFDSLVIQSIKNYSNPAFN